ncbi:MAG: L-threonylcarbamoyladenylate synthase [Candidatus Altiarchaeota archaeon]|nr:L-threonylcarbamoyladenylate synthase [Candidatus Altiarchaeota archaeon]
MELLHINADYPEKELIYYVAKEVREGRILIYPTDTVYGLGCSINARDSIKKIFEIKKRSLTNPLSVAFPDLEMVKGFTHLSSEEKEFIKKHIDDPVTFIVKKRGISEVITAGRDTVGIRIPNHRVVKELLHIAKIPIITTSANISGNKAPAKVDEIDEEMKDSVDIILDSGPCRLGSPSKVIDLSTGKILRK